MNVLGVGTCFYQEKLALLLINCELVIRLFVSIIDYERKY